MSSLLRVLFPLPPTAARLVLLKARSEACAPAWGCRGCPSVCWVASIRVSRPLPQPALFLTLAMSWVPSLPALCSLPRRCVPRRLPFMACFDPVPCLLVSVVGGVGDASRKWGCKEGWGPFSFPLSEGYKVSSSLWARALGSMAGLPAPLGTDLRDPSEDTLCVPPRAPVLPRRPSSSFLPARGPLLHLHPARSGLRAGRWLTSLPSVRGVCTDHSRLLV